MIDKLLNEYLALNYVIAIDLQSDFRSHTSFDYNQRDITYNLTYKQLYLHHHHMTCPRGSVIGATTVIHVSTLCGGHCTNFNSI